VVDFVKILLNAYGSTLEPEFPGEYRPMDLRYLVGDPSRINKIGFKPQYDIAWGVGEYVEWIRSKPSPKEYFSKAVEYLKELKIVRRANR
jgi:nucleoside-diphosphate-sugar epimerase